MQLPIEPLAFTIADILPQGLFVLAGGPKIGKSWLALDMCIAVATGGPLWEHQATQADALYLALEDTRARLQERLAKLSAGGVFAQNDIHFVTRVAKLGEGLAEQLTEFLDAHPQTKLVVIDTMQYIRNTGKFTGTYSGDYHDMDALREIIADRKLTMLLITHPRKEGDKDPLNTVTGSTGLIGAVDGVFVLTKHKRIGSEAKLTIANRDTASYQFELQFDNATCRWEFVADVTGSDNGDNNDDYLFTIINCLLDKSPTWSGTATQLCEELKSLDPQFGLQRTVITKVLKGQQEYLELRHGFGCYFSRSKYVRTIKLWRVAKVESQEDAA